VSEVIRRTVADYYAARLRQYGETARGVDWNSEASQALRFEKLLGLCRGETGFSLLDWGCGYGALLDHLRRLSVSCRYTGFDLSTEMIERARAREGPEASFTAAEEGLSPHDFVVASGIFNVKLEVPLDDWRAYVFSVLEAMDARARRGFAFNLLSLYSDPDRRRDTLFYADPLELFDHCRRRFSARVALLHDYPLYEFTLLVRKEAV
jgi:SAM-dependent methyltransferase